MSVNALAVPKVSSARELKNTSLAMVYLITLVSANLNVICIFDRLQGFIANFFEFDGPSQNTHIYCFKVM